MTVNEVLDLSEMFGLKKKHSRDINENHQRLFPVLRKLCGRFGASEDWFSASTVVLLSGYCACCEDGLILRAGIRKIRSKSFLGTIVAVAIMGDDLVIDLPDVVTISMTTAEEILQRVEELV